MSIKLENPWPFLTASISPISFVFKGIPEDFVVEEIPMYEPCGEGEHLYLWIEKKGTTTRNIFSMLAKALDLSPREMSSAGLKDKQAITRQWISLRGIKQEQLSKLSFPDFKILKMAHHKNKLRIGHLKGNKFFIRLRNFDLNRMEDVSKALNCLKQRGVPNYFGEQRFGKSGDNWQIGKEIIQGKARHILSKQGKEKAWFYISSFQSYLFNQVLAKRLQGLDQVLVGDLAWKHRNGAVFKVEDADVENQRITDFEISPSGPLFGFDMTEPENHPYDVEQEVLTASGMTKEDFRGKGYLKCRGARRPLRFPLMNFSSEAHEGLEGPLLTLQFELPSGCYATAVLRELSKS